MHVNNAGFNTRLNEKCLRTGIIFHTANILQLRSRRVLVQNLQTKGSPSTIKHATSKIDANEYFLQPALIALT